MTLPRTDFLSVEELAQIRQDVRDLFADSQIAVPITYRSFQSSTFTPGTGAYTKTFTDTALTAVRNMVPEREVAAGQGLFQAGDLRFIIARALLPTSPAKEDELVDGASTYNVVAWDTDPVGALWRVVARKVA
jgi:hypothetical protein